MQSNGVVLLGPRDRPAIARIVLKNTYMGEKSVITGISDVLVSHIGR